MISKIKLGWQFVGFLITAVMIYAFTRAFFLGYELSTYDWYILLVSMPVCIVGFGFILPTKKIIFSEQKISVYWKIAIFKWILYESSHYSMEWKNVKKFYPFIPLWLGFHYIIIYGYRNGHGSPLIIGSQYTKKKESLVYIADHVRSEVIDDNIAKLIRKYRKRAEKKGLK